MSSSGLQDDIDKLRRVPLGACRTAGESDVRAQIRLGAVPDIVVGSVHAISEDGVLRRS